MAEDLDPAFGLDLFLSLIPSDDIAELLAGIRLPTSTHLEPSPEQLQRMVTEASYPSVAALKLASSDIVPVRTHATQLAWPQ